jgi:hypothetical protein
MDYAVETINLQREFDFCLLGNSCVVYPRSNSLKQYHSTGGNFREV